MMNSLYERALGGGLALRSSAGPDDVARIAAFQGLIHGPAIAPMVEVLMREHPQFCPEHWLYVEEQATRRVVAGLCLIPWTLRYEGVALRSAEMAIVGTLEEYRGRGLIRALNERFVELTRLGGFDLSHIQGIPYFYRQFGYEYAMPLESWCRIELHQFAGAAPAGYSLRPAGPDDIPTLMRLYDAAAADLSVSTARDEPIWRFLLGPALGNDMAGPPWLIAGADGAPAGYLRVMATGFGDGLICGEASLLGADAAMAALHWLVAEARARGKPYVRLNLPPGHTLSQLALRQGAHDGGSYAWQLHLPDPPALLMKLAPIFERRLAAGPFAGLTRTLLIDRYRSGLALRFVGGRLAEAQALPSGEGGALRLPPPLLAPLLFGWRSLDELRYTHPDAYATAETRALIDALFPKARAFLYSAY